CRGVAVHASGLRVLRRLGPDHERDAHRRPESQVRLRRLARRAHPEALPDDRAPRLVHVDHARPDAREDRLGAEPRERRRLRDDGRLHRRRAALPGPRRRALAGVGPDPARLELALLEPYGADPTELVRLERLRDLGARSRPGGPPRRPLSAARRRSGAAPRSAPRTAPPRRRGAARADGSTPSGRPRARARAPWSPGGSSTSTTRPAG